MHSRIMSAVLLTELPYRQVAMVSIIQLSVPNVMVMSQVAEGA